MSEAEDLVVRVLTAAGLIMEDTAGGKRRIGGTGKVTAAAAGLSLVR